MSRVLHPLGAPPLSYPLTNTCSVSDGRHDDVLLDSTTASKTRGTYVRRSLTVVSSVDRVAQPPRRRQRHPPAPRAEFAVVEAASVAGLRPQDQARLLDAPG